MLMNDTLRRAVKAHLEQSLPLGLVKHVFDSWLQIDANEDTPAIMAYLDDGEISDQYQDGEERYDGLLTVSVYVSGAFLDSDLDAIGEAVRQALPLGFRLPGVARLSRNGYNYERSEAGIYRALHLTHTYSME